MRMWQYFDNEKEIELKIPVAICPRNHKHIPVGEEKKCLVCEKEKTKYENLTTKNRII